MCVLPPSPVHLAPEKPHPYLCRLSGGLPLAPPPPTWGVWGSAFVLQTYELRGPGQEGSLLLGQCWTREGPGPRVDGRSSPGSAWGRQDTLPAMGVSRGKAGVWGSSDLGPTWEVWMSRPGPPHGKKRHLLLQGAWPGLLRKTSGALAAAAGAVGEAPVTRVVDISSLPVGETASV